MGEFNFEIYDGKTFEDLCRDVVNRSSAKRDGIDILISDIRTQIKDKNDILTFMPRIKELLEVGIKNDEQLVKLMAVIQRIQSTQIEANGGDTPGLTDEEKEQLMQARIKELEEMNNIKKEIDNIIPLAK